MDVMRGPCSFTTTSVMNVGRAPKQHPAQGTWGPHCSGIASDRTWLVMYDFAYLPAEEL